MIARVFLGKNRIQQVGFTSLTVLRVYKGMLLSFYFSFSSPPYTHSVITKVLSSYLDRTLVLRSENTRFNMFSIKTFLVVVACIAINAIAAPTPCPVGTCGTYGLVESSDIALVAVREARIDPTDKSSTVVNLVDAREARIDPTGKSSTVSLVDAREARIDPIFKTTLDSREARIDPTVNTKHAAREARIDPKFKSSNSDGPANHTVREARIDPIFKTTLDVRETRIDPLVNATDVGREARIDPTDKSTGRVAAACMGSCGLIKMMQPTNLTGSVGHIPEPVVDSTTATVSPNPIFMHLEVAGC